MAVNFISTVQREKLLELYIGYFNRAPEADGLDYWASRLLDGINSGKSEAATLTVIANEFYTAGEQFNIFSAAQPVGDFIKVAYANALGRTSVDDGGMAFWTEKLVSGEVSRGEFVQQLISAANAYKGDATWGWVAKYLENRVAVASEFANDSAGLTGQAAITAGTNALSVVTAEAAQAGQTPEQAIAAAAAAAVGSTFTLTTGVDPIVGTAGNDTIIGNASTMSALDTIDGGAGTDTLEVLGVDAAGVAANVNLSLVKSVTNVENLVVTTTSAKELLADTNVSSWTGLTSANFGLGTLSGDRAITAAATTDVTVSLVDDAARKLTVNGGKMVTVNDTTKTGDIAVVGGTGTTSVSITGGKAVTVEDKSTTTNTITSVSVDGSASLTTTNTDALTTVSLSNMTGNTSIDNATAGHALTINVNTVTGGATIADAAAASVTLNVNGTKASDVNLDLNVATALTVNATADTTLTTTSLASRDKLVTLTEAGAGDFTADLSGISSLKSVNAATATGNLNVNLGALAATFVGGLGDDTLTLSAAPTVAVSGGEGTDVLALTNVDVTTVTAAALAKVTGFETLGLAGAIKGATLNLSGLTSGMVNVQFQAGSTLVAPLEITKGAATTELTWLGTPGQAVTYTQATDTAKDSLTVNLGSADTTGVSADLVAAKIETLHIVSHAASANITNTLDGNFAAATTLTLTGDAGVNLNGSALTKATLIDATTLKGGVYANGVVTTGMTFHGGTGGGSFNGVAAVGKSDMITFGDQSATASDANVYAGNGNNTITLGNNNSGNSQFVSVGDGDNIITLGNAGANATEMGVRAGNGKNIISIGNNNGESSSYVVVGNGDNTITLGDVGATAAGLYVRAQDVAGGKNIITLGNNAGYSSSWVVVGDGDNSITMGDYTGTNKSGNYVDAGNGNNTITVGSINATATDAQINVGNGNNTITTGAGAYIVSSGNGNNTITTGAGDSTVDLGTGANTVTFVGAGNNVVTIGASAGLNVIDVGTGTDTIVLAGIQTAAGYYASVKGMGAGDVINFTGAGTTASEATLGAKITLGGATSFANYLDASVAGTATEALNWFQYNGNTYITVDHSPNATFADGVDTVIELVGLVDLSAAVNVAGVLTLA
jgi:S-layer protein